MFTGGYENTAVSSVLWVQDNNRIEPKYKTWTIHGSVKNRAYVIVIVQ